MRVGLGFHFRNDGKGIRGEIFKRIRPIVEGLYQWDEVLVMDSGHSLYNRAATRNLIVESTDCDVIVICDADSIPEAPALQSAIFTAALLDRIVIPFDNVNVLPVNTFFVRPHKYRKIKTVYTYGESFGGVYVTRPEVWRFVGGMDERIEGWGFEDQIILSAVKTFLDGPAYVSGKLYNVNHLRDTTSLTNENNDRLIRAYHAAEGNVDEFRRIQAGSNRWCQIAA